MDDFIINFESSGTAPSKAPRKKGGRWTDRARDKRLNNGTANRKTITADAKPNKEESSVSTGTNPSRKRNREEEPGQVGDSRQVHPASSPVDQLQSKGAMIVPRRGPKAPAHAKQSIESSTPVSGKVIIGPSGKKQYISSLFTSEGLPSQSSKSSGPIVYSRPSNAPLLSEIKDGDSKEHEMMSEKDDLASKPYVDPAPALTALGLLPELVEHLATKLKITGPTACQAGSIPSLLTSTVESNVLDSFSQNTARDAILQAQTGSGKTLAFLLPILQDLLTLSPNLFPNPSEMPTRAVGTLALILTPTRELAAQIYTVLTSLLSLHGSTTAFSVPPRVLTPCLLVGGANRTHEKSRLRKGCPIIVATPGRLLDHLKTTESFRMAGESIPKRGPRGRIGSGTVGTGANDGPLGRDRTGASGRRLGLRWLVVDECDRLMDLGFEEQMKGVLAELELRSPTTGPAVDGGLPRRRTVLCSATASEGVDRLAGIALHDPQTLHPVSSSKSIVVPLVQDGLRIASDLKEMPHPSGHVEQELVSHEEVQKQILHFTPPAQLIHNYVLCPPKLRFVALIALLRRIMSSKSIKTQGSELKGTKVLVFVSCTAAVDFYWNALNCLSMGSTAERGTTKGEKTNVPTVNGSVRERVEREKAEEEAERTRTVSSSLLLPGVPIYRLHGNLDLSLRLGSLKGFSHKTDVQHGKNKGEETENAILFCTSVAARGLDVQFVSHVVQYDLPTEGGVTEYIHRVGRTARAGGQGQATSFLLPSEKEWVPWVEKGMSDGVEMNSSRSIKLREIGVEEILKNGYGGEGREFETRATDVQMGFERWVNKDDETAALSRNAFSSHIRAYATHPAAEKAMFNTKALHLGHLAKSFGMREAPGHSAAGKPKKVRSTGRLMTVKRPGQASNLNIADRAIASLPARGTKSAAQFETGHKHDEERAMLRMKAKMMMGPTGSGGGEFQIASSDMLESLAKGAGAMKRKASAR